MWWSGRSRIANNHQSGSDFRVTSTQYTFVNGVVFPRFVPEVSIIQWNPIDLASTKGTSFMTDSIS